jgi:ribonuclease HII
MIIGIDEVGLGPLAGPVVVAAAHIEDGLIEGVRDSKLVAENKRYSLADQIREKALWYQIAQRSAGDINERGMYPCLYECIYEVADAARAKYPKARILMDGQPSQNHTKKKRPWLEFLAGGDGLIYQISAASLIAKVHRDRQMLQYAEQYPGYYFEKNKGYPTNQHTAAIMELGITPIHRTKAVNRTMTRRTVSGGEKEEAELSNYEARKLLNQISGMFDVLDDWTKGFIKSIRPKVFNDNLELTPRQNYFLVRAVKKARKKKSKKARSSGK